MRYGSSLLAAAVALFSLAACNFKVTETQSIEINFLDTLLENQKLSEDLIYYDLSYLAEYIPALDERSVQGIKISSFIRSSDGQPSYRINYQTNHAGVSGRVEDLRRQFEEFIPKLAQDHIAHMSEFQMLWPDGEQWVRDFYEGDAAKLYESMDEVVKKHISQEMFLQWQSTVLENTLGIASVSPDRAQFYRASQGFPPANAMFYNLKTISGHTAQMKVSYSAVGDGWIVSAVGLYNLRKAVS